MVNMITFGFALLSDHHNVFLFKLGSCVWWTWWRKARNKATTKKDKYAYAFCVFFVTLHSNQPSLDHINRILFYFIFSTRKSRLLGEGVNEQTNFDADQKSELWSVLKSRSRFR